MFVRHCSETLIVYVYAYIKPEDEGFIILLRSHSIPTWLTQIVKLQIRHPILEMQKYCGLKFHYNKVCATPLYCIQYFCMLVKYQYGLLLPCNRKLQLAWALKYKACFPAVTISTGELALVNHVTVWFNSFVPNSNRDSVFSVFYWCFVFSICQKHGW